MTVEEPLAHEAEAVDWDTLVAVDDQVLALDRAGRLDLATFRALYDRAKTAAAGDDSLLEAILRHAPAGFTSPA